MRSMFEETLRCPRMRDSFTLSGAEPLVSVIVPAFDAATLLPDAFGSLLGQTYRNWELIVVSDDGRDYSRLLPADARVRHCPSRSHASGPGAARNVGLRQARGELIAHLDVDDIFRPERLELLVPLALEHGIALDNMRILDFEAGLPIATLFDYARTSLSFDDALELNYPIFPIYRKSVLGEWDEDIPFAEDVLFNLRAISRLPHVPVLNKPLLDYRVRPGSISCSEASGRNAENAYAVILEKLETSNFGFCPSRARSIRMMFERKANLNLRFLNFKSSLNIKSFAEYASYLDAQREVQQNTACS